MTTNRDYTEVLATFSKNISSSYFSDEYRQLCQTGGHVNYPHSLWQGAVLLLLWQNEVLMIKRREEVPSYKGHVALIGGHRHAGEVDPVLVGLREFAEETSLPPQNVQIWGPLPPIYTASMTLVIPICAELHMSEQELRQQVKSNGEWSVIFSVPLSSLACEEKWDYGQRWRIKTATPLLFRSLSPTDYRPLATFPEQHLAEWSQPSFLLWGATARILWNFLRLLSR